MSLPSFIEMVYPDNTFLIRMPVHQDDYYPLACNELYLMYFAAELENSAAPGVFAVPVYFIEKIERGGRIFARMEPLGDIVKSQRRDCYRLPVLMPVSLRRIDEPNSPGVLSVSAKMIDFSDGGLLCSADETLNVDETLLINFILNSHETVEGVIVRAEAAEHKKNEHKIAVKFTNAPPQQRQRFYQFIVEKQLERRRCRR